uniref:Uncharacterized protein n=1 Tax=Arion vulgaris TaxID=1028688 RepID=A0A0B6ZJK8_9EUPU
MLQQIWLPRFDHNLRSKEGSTPLMVAAATGKLQIIQFLLESAVFQEVTQEEADSADSDSDTDSGVLDPTSVSPKDNGKSEDEFLGSHEGGMSVAYSASTDIHHDNKTDYMSSSLRDISQEITDSSEYHQRRLTRIVHDANRPKGLSIFHDGLISHVCAMNLYDGTNVLHHTIRNSDAPHVLSAFLDVDPTPLNMQDDRGETALHISCRLRRKKCVELILARPDLDLNIRTFNGHLPEEVTSSKAILKLVGKARASSSQLPTAQTPLLQQKEEASIYGSEITNSLGGSTVNFDKVHSRYEILKNDTKAI